MSVVVGVIRRQPAHDDDAPILKGAGQVRGFLLKDYPSDSAEHWTRLVGLVSSGKLQSVYDPNIFVGLAAVADAVEYLHKGGNTGKPLVRLCSEAEAATTVPDLAAEAERALAEDDDATEAAAEEPAEEAEAKAEPAEQPAEKEEEANAEPSEQAVEKEWPGE